MAPAGKSVYYIRKAEQLIAIRSPLAQDIIAAMERLGPCCVNELAAEVGRAPESLYYHIHRLHEVGLIVEGESRQVGKQWERVYSLVADQIRVDPRIQSEPFLDALGIVFSTALRSTKRDLLQALKSGSRNASSLLKWGVHLRQDSLEELRAKLEDLEAFIRANHDPENGKAFSILIASSQVLQHADKDSRSTRRRGPHSR